MPIRVTCACGKKYTFKDGFAGRRAKCRACGQVFLISDESVLQAAPPEPSARGVPEGQTPAITDAAPSTTIPTHPDNPKPVTGAPVKSADSLVLVVPDHPFEQERGLRFHLYECAGVKSGRRSGCNVEKMPRQEAEAQGRTICAFCAEGRTDDPFYRPSDAECAAVLAKWPEFGNLRFGEDPPTALQFAYAVALGVKLNSGITFNSISPLIAKAKASNLRRADGKRPSDQEAELIYQAIVDRGPTLASMLKKIQEYHGVLPREVSPEEARRIIEFLEDYYLPCPFCGIDICATDDACCACGKNLQRMRIPIEL
jgi:hypothetical protein